MSVKSKPYFWVECDGDKCDAKAPDGDDFSAFEEPKQATEYAEDCDWTITAAGEHYCEGCATDDHKDSAHLVSDVRGDALPGMSS